MARGRPRRADRAREPRLLRAAVRGRAARARAHSNRSLWLDFPKVATADWHHGNVVLLGDAAHTAHFSIGSGTKLAMEDAIALAGALDRRRRPRTRAHRLRARAPAGRRAHAGGGARERDVLRERRALRGVRADRVRVQPADAERADHAREPHRARPAVHAGARRLVRGPAVAPPPAFAPFELAAGGSRTASARRELGRRQRGGTDVSGGRDHPRAGSCSAWTHAGRAARPSRGAGGRPPAARGVARVGADLPYGPFSAFPAELRRGWRPRRIRRRGRERSATVLELDFAHGYLLASFLSPLTNRDAYGEDRLRLPARVLDAVREAWDGRSPSAYPSPTGPAAACPWRRASRPPARSSEHGCDLIHVAAGQTVADDRPEYRRGFLTGLSDRVRAGAGVPTLVAGHLTTLDDVSTIVGAGRGDLCILDLPPPTSSASSSDAGALRGRRRRVVTEFSPSSRPRPRRSCARPTVACSRSARSSRTGRTRRSRRTPSSRSASAGARPRGSRTTSSRARPATAPRRRHPLRRRFPRRRLDRRGDPARARRRRRRSLAARARGSSS